MAKSLLFDLQAMLQQAASLWMILPEGVAQGANALKPETVKPEALKPEKELLPEAREEIPDF